MQSQTCTCTQQKSKAGFCEDYHERLSCKYVQRYSRLESGFVSSGAKEDVEQRWDTYCASYVS